MLLLLDVPEKEWDKSVSTFLLKQALGLGQSNGTVSKSSDCGGDLPVKPGRSSVNSLQSQSHWEIAVLQQYLAYCRRFHGAVIQSVEAQRIIVSGFILFHAIWVGLSIYGFV